MADANPASTDAPRWAPRVAPALIRRLYEADARGIVDEDLLDEVLYALWDRCETIRRVTHRLCPHCGGPLHGADGPAQDRHRPLACASCGWRSTWASYHRSYKGRRIHGGRAFGAFVEFLRQFPHVRSPREKMLLIDRLLHALHEGADGVWTTPGACNLIEGRRQEVIRFLDELAGVAGPDPAMQARAQEFRDKLRRSQRATLEYCRRRGMAWSDDEHSVPPAG